MTGICDLRAGVGGAIGRIWQRDVIALRAAAWPWETEDGAFTRADATHVVRKNGRLAAVGVVRGILSGDGQQVRLQYCSSHIWSVPFNQDDYPTFTEENGFDHEDVLLRQMADEFGFANNPLLTTIGGLAFDMPLIRYRALARSVPLPAIHRSIGGRMAYFDDPSGNWHMDLATTLAPQKGIRPIGLAELLKLTGGSREALTQHWKLDELEAETLAIFSLFARTLVTSGFLPPHEFRAVIAEVDAQIATLKDKSAFWTHL